MSLRINKVFSSELSKLDAAGLLRAELPVAHADNMEVQFGEERGAVNFVSNDWLGWRCDDEVREHAVEALSTHGTGSTCASSVIGTHEVVAALQERLARFLGHEDCIVFPSSYMASAGLFESLTNQRDKIFIDELSNPSMLDGTQMSSASLVRYVHSDVEDLEYHLKCSQSSRFRLIATDGVFNTDGQCAELERIQELQRIYDAVTLVDDSYALGVLGEAGRGTASHLELEQNADLVFGSFCYALGNVAGGFIAGDKDLVRWLRNTSRPYLLSEPLAPVNAAIVLEVIDRLERDSSAVNRLDAVSARIKDGLRDRNLTILETPHPFVSWVVGSTLNAQRAVEDLHGQGFLVSGLCYPNTAEDEALVRICPTAQHTDEQVDRLLDAIDSARSSLK
jgi:glycine C-acetyltransferase